MGGVLGHWQLIPCAAAVGFLLGMAVLAAIYLAPLLRLRSASDEGCRARVLALELVRLERLGNAAAVLEEHGRSSEAQGLRAEADVQALLLLAAGARARSGQGSDG